MSSVVQLKPQTSQTVNIGYTASRTFRGFHADNSFVRGVRGPVGSGKSVGSIIELLNRALQQKPNKAGFRKSRWALTRATYPELKSTTLKTFQDWLPESICPVKMNESPITAKLQLPVGDGTMVMAEFLFIALDRPKDLGKLLSLELTGAFINEAKEVDKAVLDALTSRVGRYPSMRDGGPSWSGVIMDTNSPAEDHWWAELERATPDNWKFFTQPPALLRDPSQPTGFAPNPEAENIENLPGGHQYYYNSLGGKDSNWVRAYILNEFAAVRDGKPVYMDSWADRIHISDTPLWPTKHDPIIIGIDFGLTPAAVFCQLVEGQLRILDELQAVRMGIDDFIHTAMTPLIASKYAAHERIYVGDPSGSRAMDTDERSCFDVLRKAGMPVVPASTNAIEPRLGAVRHYLTRMVSGGRPAFLLDPSCQTLKAGFQNGYQYDRVQVSGEARFKEKPAKNKFSHLHDALQYACLRAQVAQKRADRPSPPRRAVGGAADSITGY